MDSEKEWNRIRERAARCLSDGFGAAVVREARRRRELKVRLRTALLTSVVLFLAVGAATQWRAARSGDRNAALRSQYAWAQERMGLDL